MIGLLSAAREFAIFSNIDTVIGWRVPSFSIISPFGYIRLIKSDVVRSDVYKRQSMWWDKLLSAGVSAGVAALVSLIASVIVR